MMFIYTYHSVVAYGSDGSWWLDGSPPAWSEGQKSVCAVCSSSLQRGTEECVRCVLTAPPPALQTVLRRRDHIQAEFEAKNDALASSSASKKVDLETVRRTQHTHTHTHTQTGRVRGSPLRHTGDRKG